MTCNHTKNGICSDCGQFIYVSTDAMGVYYGNEHEFICPYCNAHTNASRMLSAGYGKEYMMVKCPRCKRDFQYQEVWD